jgi:sterol desaturase/sphingolipid hydroxylase (fatty acid hydroxylase superfamily)
LTIKNGTIRVLPGWILIGFHDYPVAAIALGFIAEILWLGWRPSSLRRLLLAPDRSQFTDMVFATLSVFGALHVFEFAMTFGLSWLFGRAAASVSQFLVGRDLRINLGSAPANIFLYAVLWGLVDYWFHRFSHLAQVWPVHRLHHSNTSMSPLVRFRGNPTESGLRNFIAAMPAGLVAVSPPQVIWFLFAISIHHCLVHADLPWTWGWFGRWVLISPAAHRIHHSALARHRDRNYATFTIFDRIFGSWHPIEAPVFPLGLAQPLHNRRNLAVEAIADTVEFWRGLRGIIPRRQVAAIKPGESEA